jgi:putative tryptophan/tyrosine transport system substrate-binding protein
MPDMRRRDFITLLGGAAATPSLIWPLASWAAGGRPRIGILSISSAERDASNLAAFRDGLQRLGYVEGRSIDIDYRFSNGNSDALAGLARELLQMKPDVVLASAVSPTRAMNRIAPALPIVCPAFSDSFVPSLAASFAHPGGSVTGIATDVEQMIGKLVELALDAIPGTAKIGFLANPAGGSMTRFEQQVRSTAKLYGVEVRTAQVKKADDLEGALQQLSGENVQAVIVPANGLLLSSQIRIIELAMAFRLPLIFGTRQGAVAGGLASYGINSAENYRRGATYVAKILKGAAPGDLPIEFPTKIELVLNLKTAKSLGLAIPSPLLDRADDVIE